MYMHVYIYIYIHIVIYIYTHIHIVLAAHQRVADGEGVLRLAVPEGLGGTIKRGEL